MTAAIGHLNFRFPYLSDCWYWTSWRPHDLMRYSHHFSPFAHDCFNPLLLLDLFSVFLFTAYRRRMGMRGRPALPGWI
jgi:hypothetical protein